MNFIPSIVPILPPERFQSFLSWVGQEDRHLSQVCIATFDHPKAGNIQAYGKPYQPRAGKGLFNEIAAYIMMDGRGMPQPKRAFLAFVEKSNLPNIDSNSPSYQWIKTSEIIPLFCTEKLSGHSAAIHLKRPIDKAQLKGIVDDVLKWPDYPNAVANDECIAHADRHLNNLLRLGKANYALIDNGRLIRHDVEDWSIGDLDGEENYRNCLSANDKKGATHSHSIHAAEQFQKLPESHKIELDYWINTLLTPEEAEHYQSFYQTREETTEWLLKKRWNMI